MCMTVGKRLKEERKRLGLTQVQLGEACGFTKWGQVNFEADKNLPGGAYLIAADGLGIDVAYVLTGRRSTLAPDETVLLAAYRAAAAPARSTALAALAANTGPAAAPRNVFTENEIGQVYTGEVTIEGDAIGQLKSPRRRRT